MVPIEGRGLARKSVLLTAAMVNDAVGIDRSRHLSANRVLSRSKALDAQETMRLVPWLTLAAPNRNRPARFSKSEGRGDGSRSTSSIFALWATNSLGQMKILLTAQFRDPPPGIGSR